MKNTCCFTGHRNFEISEKEVRDRTFICVLEAIHDKNITHFICGGAIGFDMIAAELIIDLKKERKITLEIAVPFREQDKYYTLAQKERYARILKKADKTTILSEYYFRDCYDVRNKYMVDNSSFVIALFDGRSGGTMNTLNYAVQTKKSIVTINPRKNPDRIFRHM